MDISALPCLPIKCFAEIIALAGINIAPERVKELKQKIESPITIVCANNSNWDIKAASFIVINRKTIEIIWALSYGYSVFFMEVIDKGRNRPGEVISFNNDPIVKPALALIHWAMDEFVYGDTIPLFLQEDLQDRLTGNINQVPTPDCNAPLGSHQDVAKRVYQAVMAFFLHHELAHIFNPDTASGDTPESEMEADRLAAQWIMDAPPNDAERTYRLIGITIGEAILAAIDIHKEMKPSDSHPPGFDRLRTILAPYAPDPCDYIWHIVGHILNLHMGSAGIGKDRITKIDVECPGELIELMLKIIRSHYASVREESE